MWWSISKHMVDQLSAELWKRYYWPAIVVPSLLQMCWQKLGANFWNSESTCFIRIWLVFKQKQMWKPNTKLVILLEKCILSWGACKRNWTACRFISLKKLILLHKSFYPLMLFRENTWPSCENMIATFLKIQHQPEFSFMEKLLVKTELIVTISCCLFTEQF